MEILNPRPALALPQTMWLCYSTVARNNGVAEEQLLRLLVPEEMLETVPQKGAHAPRAISDLIELGLIDVDSEGMLSAEPTDVAGFLRKLRRVVVVPPVDISPSFDGTPDLRAGLVWLMRQSPFSPLYWDTGVQTEMPTGLFTNDTRWNGFRFWSGALGFARPALKILVSGSSGSANHITADPTDAILDVLLSPGDASHFPSGEAIPVGTFMNSLRNELPILPGHPSAVYDGMDTDASSEWAAVGLALNCAEARGVLKMGYQSDPTGVAALPSNEGSGPRYVSWVEVLK
ncbi:protein DpdG [Nocardia sp. NPDC019304]|uniref:protein DpdG n=1 Tax=unclassified Nocardia TaxID=2637762 RepID=UPI0034015BE7